MCEDGAAKTCDGGVFAAPEVCSEVCVDGLGCVACTPDTLLCDGDMLMRCGEDGAPGDTVLTCDPVQGLSCDAGAGGCAGVCAFDEARPSEYGCEFWAAPLPQGFAGANGFGVALTNTCAGPTHYQIDLVGKPLLMGEVAAGASKFVVMPRLPPLGFVEASILTTNGSYRVRTNCPVGALQFSGDGTWQSVDATRLYPTDRWGNDAWVMSWPTQSGVDSDIESYFTVMARDDGTTVTIDSPAGIAVSPILTIDADGDGELMLDRGQILLLLAELPDDMTGARVAADGPITVFGGHVCASVPDTDGTCDHLEEVMPPTSALGKNHVVVPPQGPDAIAHMIRVVGTQDGTQVMTADLKVPKSVDAGGFIEFGPTMEPLAIAASAPVLVGQFMVSYGFGSSSDPSLLVQAPIEQFDTTHNFWTPEGWLLTTVAVAAPPDTMATLDGEPVVGWMPVKGTTMGVAVVVIDTPGPHVLIADQPVGIGVYGQEKYASYAYAGAWDLPPP
ncbi:IgGFc-binding protein [Nannocystis sp.]|uniref:IgGFc-binding protein n=1 Tax=Nannocystis sp. TaxID=1962667 RepID=UPI0025F83670|nr:IgGFc-binding protein [Nannocystis sp.]MBK7828737.1 IgGFc-binding protein [Nannocystis sp.]